MKKIINETDGPWQVVLEEFFPQFMEFCFPEQAVQIDWRKKPISLKGEFPAQEGKQICDMLFEVKLKNGEEELIMLHLELQGQKQELFAERMLDYNWTIYKKHRKPVISTAILLDSNPNWRPERLEIKNPLTGQPYHQFEFQLLKILDFSHKKEELEKETNIFALIILAQLAIMEAKDNYILRKRYKLALARKLFNSGLDKKKISQLYQFIDWLIKLQGDHMQTYQEELKQISQRESWQDWDPVYISTAEQVGRIYGLKQGRQEGLQEGRQEGRQEGEREGALSLLKSFLESYFTQKIPRTYLELMENAEFDLLQYWMGKAIEANSIEEVFEKR